MTEAIGRRQRSQNTREMPREPGTFIHDRPRGEPYPNTTTDTVTLYAGLSVGEWRACQRAWQEWRRRGRRAPR